MAEEKKTNYGEQSNSVALVGMIFSIVGLLLTISVIFSRIGIPLLIIGFILGIIGLFSKPRGKARVAIIIPLIIFLILAACISYLWKSFKTPATNFMNRTNEQLDSFDEESFNEDRFETIINEEFNQLVDSLSEDDLNQLYESSTGNNALEKRSYVFFTVLQQGVDNALTTYRNELPNYNNEEFNIENSNDEENINTEENTEATQEENPEIIEESIEVNQEQNTITESVEVFTESEQNDIEQIINILE